MPLHEVVHGLVPTRPIRPNTNTIPPIAVKLAIAEPHDFCQRIQRALEHEKETGEPAEERYRAEFHDAFEDGDEVEGGDVVETVLKKRYGVLRAGKPDDDAKGGHLGKTLEDEVFADLVRARVDRLVD